jgi:2-hydroxychromene-2-carboxylate isomerase
MGLKQLVMPFVSARLLSRERLLQQRAKAERKRLAGGRPRQVHYFHQADDPYSALTAQCLASLSARYDIELLPHVVSPPPDDAAPERERLVAYSRMDAALLARHAGLHFAPHALQPTAQALAQANRLLVAAVAQGRFIEQAAPLSAALWSGSAAVGAGLVGADAVTTAQHLAASDSLRRQLGHYLGATFFYAGEWYWGVDRLRHLEQRLQAQGALRRDAGEALLLPLEPDLDAAVDLIDPPPIDFFLSFRSPYTAIVAPRVFELGRRTGADVRLRFVLPMVMRGLPVPGIKRRYIALDAAREACVRGIPFGRINDPVGRPTERGLSLIPLAERQGLGQPYVLSFMQGVWAEGIDAGSDRGLRRIAERAGLSWTDALKAIDDPAWRTSAEANRAQLFALGLWGVPSFAVRDVAVWGQDRLWAVQEALLQPHTGTPPPGGCAAGMSP